MVNELKPIAWLMDDLVCPHRDFTSSSVVAERRAKKPKAWSVKPLVLAEDVQGRLSELEAALREAELQIEYLHKKFQPTGTGEATLARIRAALRSQS